jgi:hypothetical protein
MNRPRAAEIRHLHPPLWFSRIALVAKILVVPWILYQEIIGQVNHGIAVRARSPLRGIYEVASFSRNGREEPVTAAFPDRWGTVVIGALGTDMAGGDLVVRTLDDRYLAYNMKRPPVAPDEVEGFTLEGRATRALRQLEKTQRPEGEIAFAWSQVRGRSVTGYASLDTAASGALAYTRDPSGGVTLNGVLRGDTLSVRLKRIPWDSLPYFRYRWKPF